MAESRAIRPMEGRRWNKCLVLVSYVPSLHTVKPPQGKVAMAIKSVSSPQKCVVKEQHRRFVFHRISFSRDFSSQNIVQQSSGEEIKL